VPLRPLDQVAETGEQIERVVRAGAGFGVILHAEHRLLPVPEPFDGVVLEILQKRGPLNLFQLQKRQDVHQARQIGQALTGQLGVIGPAQDLPVSFRGKDLFNQESL